jgi:hypothetical protein
MGFAGPNPMGWQDMDAYVRRTGFRLFPWEVELLEALDDLYLAALAGTRKTPSKGKGAMAPVSDGKAVKSLLGSLGVRKVVRRKK